MTAQPPARVLTEPELDILELVLGGGLERYEPWGRELADGTVLTDAENTPLARIDEGRVTALKPFAPVPGPQGDPALRIAPSSLRSRRQRFAALTVTEVPTRDDIDRARVALATQEDPVLVVAPVARGAAPPGRVGGAGLTRAALHIAQSLRDGGPDVHVVVLPWPTSPTITTPGRGEVTFDDVVRACGAATVRAISDGRPADEQRRVDALPTVQRNAVEELYAPGQAADVERALGRGARRGAVVLFTGLSGSGKSTVASALAARLDDDGLPTTQLDGDDVRQFLSRGLGFDRASRETNVERIGYVASLVAHHGGIAIAAPIAPFAATRRRVRELTASAGAAFLLVHIRTPLDVCEARDRKGLYARARAGEISDFTGISSPYEEPDDADVVLDTSVTSVDDAVTRIRAALASRLAVG